MVLWGGAIETSRVRKACPSCQRGAHLEDGLLAWVSARPAAGQPRGRASSGDVQVPFGCRVCGHQARVMRKYFDQYYPQALQVAAAMRQLGEDRYVWTTGSWLLYEYLEQATHEQHKRMDQAVADGDVAWHALPFTWETEMLDRSMITGALGLSQSLDRRYGRTTTGAKMTDVPGHSRGLIGPVLRQMQIDAGCCSLLSKETATSLGGNVRATNKPQNGSAS